MTDSFTTEGKNYKNSFIKEEKPGTKEVTYHVITDVTSLGEKFQVEYKISDGAVSFEFEDNDDYGAILWRGGGKTVAKAIYDAAKRGNFVSIEDFQLEAGVSKTIIQNLADLGAMNDLPDTNQISMF